MGTTDLLPICRANSKLVSLRCNADIMTAEHLLQHCQLHDALRRDMWPEPIPLRDEAYGDLEKLRTAAEEEEEEEEGEQEQERQEEQEQEGEEEEEEEGGGGEQQQQKQEQKEEEEEQQQQQQQE